jgi:dolichol-phosphate mannosyltransferase
MTSIDCPQRDLPDTLISVVLPVYNEAEVLPVLVEQLRQALQQCGCQYELIFVDDGSRDASPQVLDRLAILDSRLRVVHLSRNFGHQAAVHAGLAHARGDAVVLMDSDLQDAPEAIPRFVAQWWAGSDVVYAVRVQRKEGLLKRMLFSAFHRFLASTATVRIPTDAGIFGLVDRRVVHELLALGECDRYFPGLRSWVGLRQTGIPVPRGPRYDRHPRVSLWGLVRLAKTAVFSFSNFPLRLFYLAATLAGALFAGLSSYALYCRLFTDLAIPGWTSQVLIGSFFGALNALGICILGEYVVRIYDQVRRRPLYLVDRKVNFPPVAASAAGPGAVAPNTCPAEQQADEDCLNLLREAAQLLAEGSVCRAPDALPAEEPPVFSFAAGTSGGRPPA